MSSVEAGLCGVWSCLYCDGVWLPAREMRALAAKTAVNMQAIQCPSVAGAGAPLQCPACEGASFASIEVHNNCVYVCTQCQSVHLPKASVQQLSLHLNTVPWLSPESLAKTQIGRQVALEIAINVAMLALLAL